MKKFLILICIPLFILSCNKYEPVLGIFPDLEETVELNEGESVQLYYHVYPDQASNREVILSSEDETIATVEQSGMVKGIAPGETDVHIITVDGGFTADYHIIVWPTLKGLQFEKDEISVKTNDPTIIAVNFTPDKVGETTLDWKSSDPNVATIKDGYLFDREAVVFGHTPGTTVITVSSKDGRLSASCKVRVRNYNCKIFTVYDTSFEMIEVQGGTFTMGATQEQELYAQYDEKPFHNVTLDTYYIGQYEVTQELWEAVMGNNPSHYNGNLKMPVHSLRYSYTKEFLDKLNILTGQNFTLPTEAQWEFAARGGNLSQSTRYCGSNTIGDVAWYSGNSGNTPHPVGEKLPNELGLYDMSGNVCELCTDWYGEYRPENQKNPTGRKPDHNANNTYFHVIRGGGYLENAAGCRTSRRNQEKPYIEREEVGLRLVLNSSDYQPTIYVESVSLSTTDTVLKVGENTLLAYSITPSNATNWHTSWHSTNPAVASVENGKVTALAPGKAEIVITTEDGNKTAVCNVTVQAKEKPIKKVTVNGITFNMIKVEGGSFTMGATSEQGSDAGDEEKPAHQVTLSDYYIGQTEVTQELWVAVMGSNPSRYTDNPKYPVEKVTWNTIVNDFLPKLNRITGENFTLPTEAQWEFAARGGNNSKGYKYCGSNNINDVAWYKTNSSNHPHAVGQKQPNELGLYDMSGNVMEWCNDWYDSYSAGAQTDPTGPVQGKHRIVRGGSYYYTEEASRVTCRIVNNPDSSGSIYGLRLALVP